MKIISQDEKFSEPKKETMGKRKVLDKSSRDAEEFDESPSEESSNEDVRTGKLHIFTKKSHRC